MSQNWIVERDGKKQGPFTDRQLKQMAVTGQLRPTDLVWNDGMSERVAASKIKGLFTVAQAVLPTTPAPANAVARKEADSTAIQAEQTSPFIENPFVMLALAFLPPLGFYLVWRKRLWKTPKQRRWLAVVGPLAIFSCIQAAQKATEDMKREKSKASQVQAAPQLQSNQPALAK